MSHASRILEATASGLLVALLAPPLAAATFLAIACLSPGAMPEQSDSGLSSLVLLFLGAASGAYLLGGIPSFVAGSALPMLRRRLSPAGSAASVGLLATGAYFLSFGSHLLQGAELVATLLTYGVPSFAGAMMAGLAACRTPIARSAIS